MSAILIGHPDSRVREVVISILEKGGHRVCAAGDGAQALAVFQKEKPDIVVLDDELPAMPSFKVFAEIKRIAPKAKVLIFSVRNSGEERQARPRFGVRAFRPGEVLQIIDELRDGATQARAQGERFAPRILVVDDEIGVRDILRRFLADKGYEVAVAPNGLDALALCKRLRPHLVLLDVDMPGMDGVETLRRIRELDSQVGVMMVTGNDTVETMELCNEYGAFDYLPKPFDFDYLEFSVASKILLMTL